MPEIQNRKSLRQRLFRSASGSFSLKITSITLAFLLNLLIARTIGSDGLGTYTLVISWIGLLRFPALLGFPQLMIRNVALFLSEAKWGLLRGFILRVYQIVGLFSVSVGVLACMVALLCLKGELVPAFLIALIALPTDSARAINQYTMSGFHHVVKGEFPNSVLAPLLIFLLTLSGNWVFHNKLSASLVIAFYVIASLVSAVFGGIQLLRMLPREIGIASPVYRTWSWIKMAAPFMALGALSIINTQTDIVMLGALRNSGEVGLYSVANKLASLVVFILVASNSALGPNIVDLHAKGNVEMLRKMVSKSTQIVFLSSLIVSSFLILFQDYLLGLFGYEFLQADTVMVILIIGQLVNAFVGPVGLLLNMSGNEKASLISLVVSGGANIAGNLYLIPSFGVEGAAISTALSMVIWNMISALIVFRRLKLNPTAIPIKNWV